MEKILDKALSALRLSHSLYPAARNRPPTTKTEVKPEASFEAMLCVKGAFLWFLKLTAQFPIVTLRVTRCFQPMHKSIRSEAVHSA